MGKVITQRFWLIVHKRYELVGGDGPAEVKALGLVAGMVAQEGFLLHGFNAFGYYTSRSNERALISGE